MQATVRYLKNRFLIVQCANSMHVNKLTSPVLGSQADKEDFYETGVFYNVNLVFSSSIIIGFDKVELKESELPKEKPAVAIEEESPVMPNPTKIFKIDPSITEVFFYALERLRINGDDTPKILMVGPSGFGKTSIPENISEKSGLSFFRFDCATVRDPEEWFGWREAKEGTTYFHKNELMTKIESGNCIIVFDEFNRVESWIANSLYRLLDHGRSVVVHNEHMKIGKNVILVFSINTGYQYSGTFSIDQALSNRIDTICRVGPMSEVDEIALLTSWYPKINRKTASDIVEVAVKIRQLNVVEFSNRTYHQVGSLISSGMSVRAALQHSVVSRALVSSGQDEFKQIADIVNWKFSSYTPSACEISNFFTSPTIQEKPKEQKLSLKLNEVAESIIQDDRFFFVCKNPYKGKSRNSFYQECRRVTSLSYKEIYALYDGSEVMLSHKSDIRDKLLIIFNTFFQKVEVTPYGSKMEQHKVT